MTKLDAALLLVPSDLALPLVILGAEAAFTWNGQAPRDDREFYLELGRKLSRMTDQAVETQWKENSR